MTIHGSCAGRGGEGVLLLGPPGAGKSDLLLRLLGRGWSLVADDQVALLAVGGELFAAAPLALAGRLEVRGLGILSGLAASGPARLRLVLECRPREAVPRLPEPATWQALGVSLPAVPIAALDASAPDKAAMALEVALGRVTLAAGALEAGRPVSGAIEAA
jgi:HPr kinase/phosphorylase